MTSGPPVLAIDLGGSSVRAEVHTAGVEVLAAGHRRVPAHAAPGTNAGSDDVDALIDATVGAGRDALDRLDRDVARRVASVGLVVPGLVDSDTGVVRYGANLGWRDVPVGPRVSAALHLPVAVANDVRSAGEAELSLGSARGLQDALVVVIGTGISSVVVADGRIVEGLNGQAGEIGHMLSRPDGPLCGCGRRGCLEAIGSAGAISRRYQQATGRAVDGTLEVMTLLTQDVDAARLWMEATDAIADTLLSVAALLAPSTVVIGGGLAAAGAMLFDPVRERMHARATIETVPDLRRAKFGVRAGLVGAGLLARRKSAWVSG